MRRFYCKNCDRYNVCADFEVPLRVIVTIHDDLTDFEVQEDPRCSPVEASEIEVDKLTCIRCKEQVVVKSGRWEFIEED